MKTQPYFIFLMLFACVLPACGDPDPKGDQVTPTQDQNDPVQANRKAGNPEDCENLATLPADIIPVSQATELVKNYVDAYGIVEDCNGDESNPAGYFLKMEDIEAMTSSGGIRIYFGRDPDSNSEKTHLIKVAVDANGNDRLEPGLVRNFSAPCPKVCDPFGLLFTCTQKIKDKGMRKPERTLEEMDIELAKRYTAKWRSQKGIPDTCTEASSSAQVRSYWISSEALNTVLFPEGINAMGVMLYFGQNTKTKGDRIFLLSVPVIAGITGRTETYDQGVLLINKTSPGDLCYCESGLAGN